MSDGEALYRAYLEELEREFPGVRVIQKRGHAMSKLIDRALKIVTLGGQSAYLTRYTTVIGKRIYVPLYTRDWLVVLDAADGRIEAWWPATIGNHATEISKDGTRLYVGNMVSDAIYVYDTATGKVVMSIDAGESVRPVVLDEPRGLLYYQLSRLHGFEVRKLSDGSFVRRVELPPLEKGIPAPGGGLGGPPPALRAAAGRPGRRPRRALAGRDAGPPRPGRDPHGRRRHGAARGTPQDRALHGL